MREIPGTSSNAIISTVENFSRIFIEILQSTKNFAHFERKDQLHSLDIFEFIDPDKCGYFNAPKPLF